jgi:maleate cis-trans isomerase
MDTDIITPGLRLPAAERPRLGILYPRGGSAFEFYQFAEYFNDNIRCYLIGGMHAFGGNKTHYPDPLLAIGAVENLSYPTRSMKPLNVHSAIWSSTSASFIGGMQWSRDQSAALTEILGAPVSSTALAYVDAIHAMRIEKVAILASYPKDVTAAFRRFLGEADIAVTDFLHLDADCGEDAYNIPMAVLIEKAKMLDVSQSEALLVPDTAMAAFELMRRLEEMLDIPVLTANQVTLWQALRLAGARVATEHYGRLFMKT